MNVTGAVREPEVHAATEFGGPVGNAVMIAALPAITYFFFFCVRFNGGALIPGADADVAGFLAAIKPTWTAVALYAGWLGLQAALQAWAPGPTVLGTELPYGGRLAYRMNGLASLGITGVVVAALVGTGLVDPGVLHDQFGALITVMTLFTLGFSAWLYRYGLRHGQAWRITGNPVADFWFGTGHNPRLPPGGSFDLKLFCEARPGLILWVLLDLSMAYAQWRAHGTVSTAMLLVCAFQGWYVLDYYLHEPAILTTMDIKHENFGYMLAFGDLVWVPMTYCLQAAYLVEHGPELSWWAVGGIVAVNVAGQWIFRSVNNQKDRFRKDPDGAVIWGRPAAYLTTRHGNKLLLSGFWGWSRHFNYVGDLLMAVSWSLPCGFASPLPWYYPIYFATLLVHRERRDHAFCREKYGEDWDRYCEQVPWRILPGVY